MSDKRSAPAPLPPAVLPGAGTRPSPMTAEARDWAMLRALELSSDRLELGLAVFEEMTGENAELDDLMRRREALTRDFERHR